MKTKLASAGRLLIVSMFVLALVVPAHAADPDYSAWGTLLTKHYDPAKGWDYKSLKANETATINTLRQNMAKVNVASLAPREQLAYWINLYNISTVSLITENYPLKSIKNLSTDRLLKLNVFNKPFVKQGSLTMSLNDIENDRIRDGFKDPRIHFAINCAARSCPPIRNEPYLGSKLDAQLDDQTRNFLNGPLGAKLKKDGDGLDISTTKIMSKLWFGGDFDKWGGGKVAFLRKYVSPDKQKMMDAAGKDIDINYDDYSWDLNEKS